mgnify:FL=1
MKNIYETLREYLELKINNLKQDKNQDILNLYETIKIFLSTPKNKLNELDDNVHKIICVEILKDPALIKNYRLLCVYSNYIDNPFLSNDPQIIEANKYYKIIFEKLNNLLKTLEIQVYKLKRKSEESQALISVYENYLTLFDTNGIKKNLELEELNAFFEFLKNSTLDKEVILNLITEFSKFNIVCQVNKQKLKISSIIREIDIKASEVTKEISEEVPSTAELKSEGEIFKGNLTQEEERIFNKIKVIISELKGVTGDSSLLELLDDEFTINGRKEIYEVAGQDKWKLIYDDITQNLLPNLGSNKESILAIFEYIINTYTGKKEKQPESPNLDIKYDDILLKEETRINKYLELSKKSRFIYESYDEDKQKLIDIAYSYLQKGDEIGLKSLQLDISLTDIVFMKNLDKMKSLISDWKMLIGLTNKEIISYGMDEYKESIKETSDSIVSILNNLDGDYEKIKSDGVVKTPEEPVVNSNDQENYVIFLNDENGVPIVFDTIKKISANDNLGDICRSINNIVNVNYFEFMEKYTTSTVKPIRDPQMYKVRRGKSRVAFIQVPISSKNREKISKKFENNKRFNLVLVVDFGFKYSDSKNQSVYDEFNRIYDINIKQIIQMFNLFGKDFNDQSFEEAQKMLLDGIETVKEIEKVSKSREKKGV